MNDLTPTLALEHSYEHLIDALLVTTHLARGHTALHTRHLTGEVSLATLPDRAVVTSTVRYGTSTAEHLAEVDGAVVSLATRASSGFVSVSAPTEQLARSVLEEVCARVVVVEAPRTVQVSFTDVVTGRRYVRLDVSPWREVERHFPPDVRTALEELVQHRPTSAVEARRLILWHGAPGTGKTSAIRALLHAWRDWADGVIVSDPTELLSSGGYLRSTVLERGDNDRWKLVVLEDAESLLVKGSGGTAMGKLLNLCDGLLGQGLRCLFLITTNERLDAMHPALIRPGRCLAQVEFGPLPAVQAASLLGRPVDQAMTLAEVMAAAPLLVQAPTVSVGQYL
jgi:hypothetical protein